MKVSVIIPTFNEENVIQDCLESLSKQSFKDFEIVVIDDGSTDKTVDVLSKILISNFKFQILHQKHKGPGEARNLGAKSAKGDIFVFVDADMTFDSHFIEDLVKPIIKGDQKGTFSKHEFVSNWESVWSRCWNINENLVGKSRLPHDYPDKQKVFRAILKSEFEKVGGFDSGGHYTDDWSLSAKLGYEAVVVEGAKFYHNNAESLGETFTQARWIGKRDYKFGFLGAIVALVRSSLPISIFVGIIKSVKSKTPEFLIFKIIYDIGILIGIIEYFLLRKIGK